MNYPRLRNYSPSGMSLFISVGFDPKILSFVKGWLWLNIFGDWEGIDLGVCMLYRNIQALTLPLLD